MRLAFPKLQTADRSRKISNSTGLCVLRAPVVKSFPVPNNKAEANSPPLRHLLPSIQARFFLKNATERSRASFAEAAW